MLRKIKKSQSHSAVFLAFIFVIIPFLAFSQKKTESKFYDNKGSLIADPSYKITKKQLKTFLKVEDSILNCYLKNLKYPAKAHEYGLESIFILTFSIDKKTRKLYNINGIVPGKKSEKFMQAFLNEFLRINPICYPENNSYKQLKNKTNIYYLPFKFKIKNNEDPKLIIENGYIFMQVVRKPIFERCY
jgi:hypothetical protein